MYPHRVKINLDVVDVDCFSSIDWVLVSPSPFVFVVSVIVVRPSAARPVRSLFKERES